METDCETGEESQRGNPQQSMGNSYDTLRCHQSVEEKDERDDADDGVYHVGILGRFCGCQLAVLSVEATDVLSGHAPDLGVRVLLAITPFKVLVEDGIEDLFVGHGRYSMRFLYFVKCL